MVSLFLVLCGFTKPAVSLGLLPSPAEPQLPLPEQLHGPARRAEEEAAAHVARGGAAPEQIPQRPRVEAGHPHHRRLKEGARKASTKNGTG